MSSRRARRYRTHSNADAPCEMNDTSVRMATVDGNYYKSKNRKVHSTFIRAVTAAAGWLLHHLVPVGEKVEHDAFPMLQRLVPFLMEGGSSVCSAAMIFEDAQQCLI